MRRNGLPASATAQIGQNSVPGSARSHLSSVQEDSLRENDAASSQGVG